jgi:hypothetical protein
VWVLFLEGAFAMMAGGQDAVDETCYEALNGGLPHLGIMALVGECICRKVGYASCMLPLCSHFICRVSLATSGAAQCKRGIAVQGHSSAGLFGAPS